MNCNFKKYSLLGVMLLWALLLSAQVDFKLQAPKYAKQGQRFKISFVLNDKPESEIQLPNINGLRLLMGPSTSQSTSVQIVNGKMTRNSSYSFSYIFLAEQKGKFTIPSVAVSVDGKTYNTRPATIEVLESDSQVPNQGNAQSSQRQQRQQLGTTTPSKDAKENFFVRVLLSKNKAYPNEHIVATLKLYTRYNGISDVSINAPSFKGFFSKEIPNSGQNQFTQENIKGKIYNTAVIGKYVLFPQRSGKLTIDDFSIDALASVRAKGRSIFDDFFGNAGVQQFKVSAKNPTTTVTVLPLPTPKPTSFASAVGNFNITSSLNADSIAVNEAVTLKFKISGNGNLQMQKAPTLNLSPDLEMYDPKSTNNTGITTSGMNGSVSYEYLIIPRQPGIFEIPAISFSYFNPKTKKYETKQTTTYTLKVANADGKVVSSGEAISHYQTNKQDVAVLGNDIEYIKVKQPKFVQKGYHFWNSWAFWLLFLGIPTLAILYYILAKKHNERSADTLGNKSKRANKVAIKRLKTAKKSLEINQKEEFYAHTLEALWGFVSDKLHLPTAKLNKDNVQQLLQEKDIDETTISEYIDTLNDCEMAQYAPVSSVNMRGSYENAISIISKLEEKL